MSETAPTEPEAARGELRVVNERLLLAGLREQQLAEEARRHAAQLEALLTRSSDGVAIVEPDGSVSLVNPAGREILGLREGGPYGRPLELPLQRADCTPIPEAEHPLARIRRGERFSDLELCLPRPPADPQLLSFSGTSVPIEADGRTLGMLVFRDVTELRRLEQIRADLVSLVSHDLRTPLTSVITYAELLESGLREEERERQAEWAGLILQGAWRLSGMIDSLLDSARMDSGQIKLVKRRVELNELVQAVVYRLAPRDGERVRVDTGAELEIEVDTGRIERAVDNLLSNALKYSSGPVRLATGWAGEMVTISVSDGGDGISAAEQERLFQRFSRGSSGKRGGGIGLGLYSARIIVEAHGGRMDVDTRPGDGSTFRISLPRS